MLRNSVGKRSSLQQLVGMTSHVLCWFPSPQTYPEVLGAGDQLPADLHLLFLILIHQLQHLALTLHRHHPLLIGLGAPRAHGHLGQGLCKTGQHRGLQ